MTIAEILALARFIYNYNQKGLITPEQELDLFEKLLAYLGGLDANSLGLKWNDFTNFNNDSNRYAEHHDRWFKSKIDDPANNIGNEPPTEPNELGEYENDFWKEISVSESSPMKEWMPGLFGPGLQIVFYNYQGDIVEWQGVKLWHLVAPQRPFLSENIVAEIEAGIALWQPAQKVTGTEVVPVLPDMILSGLETENDPQNPLNIHVKAGSWLINNATYQKSGEDIFTLDAADPELNRIDLIVATTNSDPKLQVIKGTAALAYLEPDLPENTVKVRAIVVGPDGVEVGTPEPATAANLIPPYQPGRNYKIHEPIHIPGGTAYTAGIWTANRNFKANGQLNNNIANFTLRAVLEGGSGSPDTAAQIRDKLHTLAAGSRLNAQFIDGLPPFPDKVLSGGEITIDGSDVIVAPVLWFIGGVVYQKGTPTTLTPDTITTGFKRIDSIILNANNEVLLLEGDPTSANNPTKPTLPANTIELSFILITDESLIPYEPENPLNLQPYNQAQDGPVIDASKSLNQYNHSSDPIHISSVDNLFIIEPVVYRTTQSPEVTLPASFHKKKGKFKAGGENIFLIQCLEKSPVPYVYYSIINDLEDAGSGTPGGTSGTEYRLNFYNFDTFKESFFSSLTINSIKKDAAISKVFYTKNADAEMEIAFPFSGTISIADGDQVTWRIEFAGAEYQGTIEIKGS